VVKVLRIRFASPQVHISNFKVTPDYGPFGIILALPEKEFRRREKPSALTMTQVVGSSAVVGEEIYRVVIRDVLRVLLDEFRDRVPEGRDRLHVFQHRKGETWMSW